MGKDRETVVEAIESMSIMSLSDVNFESIEQCDFQTPI